MSVRGKNGPGGGTSAAGEAAPPPDASTSVRRALGVAVLVGLALGAVAVWKLRIIDTATVDLHLTNMDFFTQIYPMQKLSFEMLLEGNLPLWNPHQSAGAPILASLRYGVLYPFNFLHLIFPTHLAIEYTTVLHLWMAGAFAYAYGRVIKLSLLCALAAGAAFMLAGSTMWLATWYTPLLCAAVWAPLSFAAVELLIRSPRPRWVILLGVSTCMPILAGTLQYYVYCAYGLGLYTVVRLASELGAGMTLRGLAGRSAYLLTGMGIGILLAAAQLLPSAELAELGPRQPGTLAVNQLFAYGGVKTSKLLHNAVGPEGPGLRRAFVGSVGLMLLAVSLIGRSRWKPVVALWAVALFSFVVALGPNTPLFSLFLSMPTGNWFRSPERILFLGGFAVAVLLGCGLQVMLDRPMIRSLWRSLGLAILGTGVLAAVHATMDVDLIHHWEAWAALAALWAMAFLPARKPLATLGVGILGLLVWQMSTALWNPYRHPYHGLEILNEDIETWEYIRGRQGFARTYIYNPHPAFFSGMAKQGSLQGLYSVTDYESLTLRRIETLFSLLDSPSSSGPFLGRLIANPNSPYFHLLDLFSVRFIAASRLLPPFLRLPDAAAGGLWRPIFVPERGSFVVYEHTDPLPRAYTVFQSKWEPDGAQALEAISRESFDPHRTVVLEGVPAASLETQADPAPDLVPARITDYRASKVTIQTNSERPGYLVLTDSFYPGWEASIDGARSTILRANYLFRAVQVPAGRHTIEFRYAPRSFRAGATISLATLLALLAFGAHRYARPS